MKHQEDIVDRLGRFYREAGLEVPASPPAWIAPQRRRRPSWQPVLASAGLAAVALSLFFAVRLARDQANQVRATASPTVRATVEPTATPTVSVRPSPDASWVTQRFPVGSVSAMLLNSSAVFSVSGTKLARIDRATGAVSNADIPANTSGIAETTAGLWLASGPTIAPAGTNAQWLTLLDPVTLKVKRQVHLPGQPAADINAGPQLAAGNQLWLGYGTGSFRLSPDTGDQLSSLNLPGAVTSLSIDPSGQRLYVGVGPSQTQPATVVELDANTGSKLASANTGGAGLGGPRVAAASDGVWVSYATGTMGLVEHRSGTNLSTTGGAIRTSNTARAVVSAGALWIVDGMAQQLTCADPASGVTRASTAENQPATFVADASGAFLGDSQGVAALQPPASCRG
ncbi:MAG TPA: hypothetical protein VGD57_06955 [Candidatus Dormibacteraeota bacterium]|jgi:hypothetical protein